ncbi:hypothetical protein wHmb_05340 [Wolbachia pipientis]|nr:hypothetical protein wHmb_01670 [Wolbachia pipientis]GKS79648.1 hypothetical protein wHmb_05340 [Wolbachia pipientis]
MHLDLYVLLLAYIILSIIIYYYYIYIIYKGFGKLESSILADFRHMISRNAFGNAGGKASSHAGFRFLISNY